MNLALKEMQRVNIIRDFEFDYCFVDRNFRTQNQTSSISFNES